MSLFLFLFFRWLSCYDVAVSTLRLFDAYQLFYYAFLPDSMQITYKAQQVQLFRKYNFTPDARAKIREVQAKSRKKKLTEDRKKRIYEKVTYEWVTTKLTLEFYASVLPMLKSYVCLFQTKQPMVHNIHDEQTKLFSNFLTCYIRSEHLFSKSAKQLEALDLEDESLYLHQRQIFIPNKCKEIIKERPKDLSIGKFYESAAEAYTKCGQYLQKKLTETETERSYGQPCPTYLG